VSAIRTLARIRCDADSIRTDERGIATIGDVRAAWFKDPDGNILGLTSD